MLSIFNYLFNGEYFQAVILILSRCFVVFCCVPIHEAAHGLAAYKLGDSTAKQQGRITLNPFKHLNPLGTVMLFLFGIGYGDPVPVNANNFKKPKQGMALTALAGPLSNLIMGIICVWIYVLIQRFLPWSDISSFSYAVAYFFQFAAYINIMLTVFNLFPIPPLDGSKILAAVLPSKAYFKYMRYERYIMIALMILLFAGVLDTPISWLSVKLYNIIAYVPYLIFFGG